MVTRGTCVTWTVWASGGACSTTPPHPGRRSSTILVRRHKLECRIFYLKKFVFAGQSFHFCSSKIRFQWLEYLYAIHVFFFKIYMMTEKSKKNSRRAKSIPDLKSCSRRCMSQMDLKKTEELWHKKPNYFSPALQIILACSVPRPILF